MIETSEIIGMIKERLCSIFTAKFPNAMPGTMTGHHHLIICPRSGRTFQVMLGVEDPHCIIIAMPHKDEIATIDLSDPNSIEKIESQFLSWLEYLATYDVYQ
jgi:hypothetical protein